MAQTPRPAHRQIFRPKAADCLEKDREALLAFYDFPAEQLDSSADHLSDRIHLCHGAAQNHQDPRLRLPGKHPGQGLHAGEKRRAALAKTERNPLPGSGHRRHRVQGRSTRRRRENRRLIRSPSTKFDHCSGAWWARC
ncbi:protein of unknown function (plasmid) [Candidatus Methylocalor cossyra]|uniref:Uncharacterized protein n=1 Tax=Candidatus Methylocalor cossyra TaxID=3108543 RepID=A0ABM9NN67_9GAMM